MITVDSHYERFTYQISEEVTSFPHLQFIWITKSRDVSEKELT